MLADLYLRKSTADAGKSVGQQDDETTDAVTRRGWTIGRPFTDDARSASRYAAKGRPDFTALLAHIRAGSCELLAVWEGSRPSRRELTYFQLLEACRDAGTLIFVVTHDRIYDVRRRADWKVLAREALDAADYSAAISEASTRGKRARARLGLADGSALDGYRAVRDEAGKAVGREKDPVRGPIVARILREALARRDNSAIARGLNADGITTRTGKAWRPANVTRIVTNPGYAAIRVYRGKGDDRATFPGGWEPFITETEHRTLLFWTRDPARRTQRGTAPVWLLSGVARCGRPGCGGAMGSKTIGGRARYACRKCNGVIVVADLTDEFVTDVMLARLRRPDAAQLFAPRVDNIAVARIEDEKAALQGELAEWRALAKARKVSPASFAEFEAALLPQIEAAERRAQALRVPAALAHLAGVDIPAKWGSFDVATRREIVRTTVRVTILPAARRGQRWTEERVRIERADQPI